MGFQKSQLFRVNLHSIKPDGGNIPMLDVIVQRVYPLLFLENHKGVNRVLTQRGESITTKRFEQKLVRMRDSKSKEIAAELSALNKAVAARGRAFNLANKYVSRLLVCIFFLMN